jgi:hypothetical protein
MKKTLVVVLAALALASCGGSSSSSNDGDGGNAADSEKKVETPDTFATTAVMRDAFNATGLSCLQYKEVAKADRDMGLESATGVSDCEVAGETIQFVVWKDNGQRDNFQGVMKTVGCAMGESFGITKFDWVQGDKWNIVGTSETLATQIADKFGGKAISHDC